MGLSFPSYIMASGPSIASFLPHTPSAASRVLSKKEDTVQDGVLTPHPVAPGIRKVTKDPRAPSKDSRTNLKRLPLAKDGPRSASVRIITAMDENRSNTFPSMRSRHSQKQIISHYWRPAGNGLVFP